MKDNVEQHVVSIQWPTCEEWNEWDQEQRDIFFNNTVRSLTPALKRSAEEINGMMSEVAKMLTLGVQIQLMSQGVKGPALCIASAFIEAGVKGSIVMNTLKGMGLLNNEEIINAFKN